MIEMLLKFCSPSRAADTQFYSSVHLSHPQNRVKTRFLFHSLVGAQSRHMTDPQATGGGFCTGVEEAAPR